MDDSASIAGTLSPALGTGSGGQSVFSITSGNSTATANFTMFVTVSGLRPGGTYQLQIYAHDVPVKPALSVTLPPAISDRSVTSSGPPQSVLANAAFSYHLLPIAATSQKIGFGGEASFIQVGICAANASSAAVAGSAAADLAPVPPPACPTLMIASAQVTDSPYGDYTIKLTAPPQAGTYQITTIVSGNPLKESPKTVTVVLAGGSSGGTLSPAPTQTSVPVPAPAPGPSGSVPLIVPGLGSIQLLTQDQTQNGASVSFRVRDATGKPYTMLAFLAVVAPAADVVTAALDPVTFRSVPSASAGEYSVSVALTSSGRYSLLLYKCALATCVDVMPASTRGSGSVTPDMTLALAVPTGPLSPQTTTVNASTSFALNAVGSFIVTARDSNGLVSSQERDTARFAVTADHGVTGASFVDRYDGTYVCQFTPTETARYAFKVYIVSTML